MIAMINGSEIQVQTVQTSAALKQNASNIDASTSNFDEPLQTQLNQAVQNTIDTEDTDNSATPDDPFAPQTMEALLAAQEQSAENSVIELTPEEQEQVNKLKQRDREVRSHEQAHKNVGGAYTGAISYTTTTGPDGKAYAIGGEVQIDSSPVPNNPEATIRKMKIVERAALAPAEPSPQDIQVARQAQAQRLKAQQELRALQNETAPNATEDTVTNPLDEIIQAALTPASE